VVSSGPRGKSRVLQQRCLHQLWQHESLFTCAHTHTHTMWIVAILLWPDSN
jgi:hypothetical protein